MAVPKRRTSQARKRKRRSHLASPKAEFSSCPRCHSVKRPHHICLNCGYYKGREIVETKGLS